MAKSNLYMVCSTPENTIIIKVKKITLPNEKERK